MKKILIINGPNLNLLGTRQPEIYGCQTFEDYLNDLRQQFPEIEIEYFQSNIEGELIDSIHKFCGAGIVINAGGYTHTSVAIADAIKGVETPVVEVHISNITSREPFRHTSMLSPVCAGAIFGFGMKGYSLAITALL